MKAIWKGGLSFGLVNIPVKIYAATQEHSLGFKVLHAKCHTPLNYMRWCPHCKQEVAWQDIVKGIQLANGSYYIITPEKLKELKPEKTDSISIIEFVRNDAIPPIYYDHHYYLAPTTEGTKAFVLFIETLEKLHMVAIGQFVLKDKEYVCAIQPYAKTLLLSTLNYDYEIRPFEEKIATEKITAQELTLAEQLVNKLVTKKFDMSMFKDTFAQQLQKKIKSAMHGKKNPKKEQTVVKQKKIKKTLTESLKESLKQPAAYARKIESSRRKMRA